MAIEWKIRGLGPGATIIAECSGCKGIFEIERPTMGTHIRHCGNTRNKIPERIWEAYCDCKEMKLTGRLMNPVPGKQPPTAGDELNKLPSAADRHPNVRYL